MFSVKLFKLDSQVDNLVFNPPFKSTDRAFTLWGSDSRVTAVFPRFFGRLLKKKLNPQFNSIQTTFFCPHWAIKIERKEKKSTVETLVNVTKLCGVAQLNDTITSGKNMNRNK